MNRLILVVIMLVATTTSAQTIGNCPATVIGTVEIYAVAYYLHEDPNHLGYRYLDTSPPQIVTDTTVYAHAEGVPVAIEWYSRPYGVVTKEADEFTLAKTCGIVPDPVFPVIFTNGFDGGSTTAWSQVVP